MTARHSGPFIRLFRQDGELSSPRGSAETLYTSLVQSPQAVPGTNWCPHPTCHTRHLGHPLAPPSLIRYLPQSGRRGLPQLTLYNGGRLAHGGLAPLPGTGIYRALLNLGAPAGSQVAGTSPHGPVPGGFSVDLTGTARALPQHLQAIRITAPRTYDVALASGRQTRPFFSMLGIGTARSGATNNFDHLVGIAQQHGGTGAHYILRLINVF